MSALFSKRTIHYWSSEVVQRLCKMGGGIMLKKILKMAWLFVFSKIFEHWLIVLIYPDDKPSRLKKI